MNYSTTPAQTTYRRKRPAARYNTMCIDRFVHGQLNEIGEGVQVSPSFWARGFPQRPPELVRHGALHHPRGIAHPAPAALRTLALSLDYPRCTVSGLSSLALLGLPFFADACDTSLNGRAAHGQDAEFGFFTKRRKACEQWLLTWRGLTVQSSSMNDALVEAIQDIRDGAHSWHVPGWAADPELFRAVSLIDACRRHLGLDPSHLPELSRGKINRRWLLKAIGLSSHLADSPKETEMRLMCHALFNEPRLAVPGEGQAWSIGRLAPIISTLGISYAEQVPLFRGDRLITVFDIAFPEIKVGVMYDGEHHLERSQRDKDSAIGVECAVEEWLVLRFSAGTLQTLPWALTHVLAARGYLEIGRRATR